jgi:uncharacterized protein YodC (DUF2158 family)
MTSINTTIDACIAHAHQAIDANLEDPNADEDGLFEDVRTALTALKISDEPEIKQGSVVKLNSGGKPMTVNKIKGELAELVWFDGETNTFKDDRFAVNMLRVLPTQEERLARSGTVGTLGHIAPLSQNNSQSSECVGPNFGTVGTHPVGTKSGLGSTRPRLIIARCLVVGVDLMTKANPGARKSIAVIETRFEADESLAVGEQREMAAAEDR